MEGIIDTLMENAINAWVLMRQEEGNHLQEAIEQQLDNLEALTGEMGVAAEKAKEEAVENLRKRILEVMALSEEAVKEQRLAQEIVLLSDRWDVSEETERLRSHLLKFRDSLHSRDAVGRKLDFLSQEINRELNTLDSKVSASNVRWMAVEGKTTLEKVREQIQNIE